jgi:hypothetical protein
MARAALRAIGVPVGDINPWEDLAAYLASLAVAAIQAAQKAGLRGPWDAEAPTPPGGQQDERYPRTSPYHAPTKSPFDRAYPNPLRKLKDPFRAKLSGGDLSEGDRELLEEARQRAKRVSRDG